MPHPHTMSKPSRRRPLWLHLAATAVVALSFAAAPALANEQTAAEDKRMDASQLSNADKAVLHTIVGLNRQEVALSSVEQEQGESAEVKDLARKIERDHAKLTQRIKDMTGMSFEGQGADTAGLSASVGQDLRSMNEAHRVALAAMQGMSGDQLDREYLNVMIEAHADAIERLEAAKQMDGLSDGVRRIVDDALKSVRKHHEMAMDVQQQVASR